MTTLRTTVTLLCLCFFCVSCATEERHTGTWNAVDNDTPLTLTLQKDGIARLETAGTVMGGADFEWKGVRVSSLYTVDYTVIPYRLTIMMKNTKTDTVVQQMAGTIAFSDATTATICLKIVNVSDEKNQVEFTAKDCMVFKKE